MNEKARSTSSGEDQEVGATPLVNSKNHGPAPDPLPLERIVEWRAAFDKTHSDPAKNYGIHGAECRWILKGERGAVQFLIYTNWYLPHVAERLAGKCNDAHDVRLFFQPMGADVGYHALERQYESQSPTPNCPYLDGRPCFYDGSGLAAETMLALLIDTGGEAVWKAMEERYAEMFAGVPA